MQVFTPIEVAKHAANKYLGVLVAAKYARILNEFPRMSADIHEKKLTTRALEELTSDETRTVLGFRAAYVFDVEQTDGEPLPAPSEASGDPGAATEMLKASVLARGIAIDSVDDLDGALGTSSGGHIRLLRGLSPAMEFTTLVHEYAHELLHHADDRPASRDSRELEAEAVAFVVGTAVGLDVSDAARDYIHLYRGDREALAASLNRIQRAASAILVTLTPTN